MLSRMNKEEDIQNGYGFYCDLEEPIPTINIITKPKKINHNVTSYKEEDDIIYKHPIPYFLMGIAEEPIKYVILGLVSCISTCILCTWSYK
tara:strand:- start:12253 stop:12525 length:273 start_codon:yes stop_codon:yes gene_type:complete